MHDLVIRNGLVVDGTGAPGGPGDVAVDGGRITGVEPAGGAGKGRREIDADGLLVLPGWVDIHTHYDGQVTWDPDVTPSSWQGVTTVVTGNCGISLAPLEPREPPPAPLSLIGDAAAFYPSFQAYRAALARRPPLINAALMVGHSTLRVGSMADWSQAASADEIATMRAKLGEALDAGVVGFSTGLFYPPGRPAPIPEVVALAALLADTGAVYTTHMRDEGDAVEDSIEESLETARRAGVPLVISHHKCVGQRNFGRSRQTLAKVEQARRTQEVMLDVYPYAASSTVLLPEFVNEGVRITIAWSKPHPELVGCDLADVAAAWRCDLKQAATRLDPAGAIYHAMNEDDVRRILAYPHSMVASDGLPHDIRPHPRLWGTFPRVLGHYVREIGLLTLEDAVRRMTGLPAANYRLDGRGVVREGAYADLVLFDPATIIDTASYDDPVQPAKGIEMVLVNGCTVLDGGQVVDHHAGRVLSRKRTAS